ncbi:MAG: Kef-type K+ transport system membrane component KefB [Flavobacteriaceae bacterium]|jgi:Kef-type K+ transport system membrane component KefB
MAELIPFFIVLSAGILFSSVFNRLHLPWVIALLLGGIIIGPTGFALFELNPTIDFLAEIGLVFLMFMAGLELRFSNFKEVKNTVLRTATINGLIPFFLGVSIGYLFGYDLIPSLLIGVIFISSSIAVVIPSLEASGLIHAKLGQNIIASTMFQDVASLILLSLLFQNTIQESPLPLPLFYLFLVIIIFVMRWVLPKVRWLFTRGIEKDKDVFQQELRTVFVLLIGTVLLFQVLGLHAIIGGFFAGFILSSSVTSKLLLGKLRAISYGLFIPIFFITVGVKTDFSALINVKGALALTFVIVSVSLCSKFLSGFLGGRVSGFSRDESAVIGVSSIPQLSTTLAVAFAGFETGLIDDSLVTAMVMLSIVTTFVGPLLIKYFTGRLSKKARIPVFSENTKISDTM